MPFGNIPKMFPNGPTVTAIQSFKAGGICFSGPRSIGAPNAEVNPYGF